MKNSTSTNAWQSNQKKNFTNFKDLDVSEKKIELESLKEMIGLLKEYELDCIAKLDLEEARQTNIKISHLQNRANDIYNSIHHEIQAKNIADVYESTHQAIRQFQEFWERQINLFVQELNQSQIKLLQEQQKQLKQIQIKIWEEEKQKGMKYSARVLQLRKAFAILMKMKSYEQAQSYQQKLKQIQKQQQTEWQEKIKQRMKMLCEIAKKKHLQQFQTLKARNQLILSKRLKQKDDQLDIILKKNRIKKIETSKNGKHRSSAKNLSLIFTKTGAK